LIVLTFNLNIKSMKKITLLTAIIFSIPILAQVLSGANSSIEEPQLLAGQYTNTGAATIHYNLVNEANKPLIRSISMGSAFGFIRAYIPHNRSISNLIHRDFEGVSNSNSETIYKDDFKFEAEEILSSELSITEIFPGQIGEDLTVDWFEIKNIGDTPYVKSQDGSLFYDDESADATTADLINGIDEIQPGESVIILITDTPSDVDDFIAVWGPVIDLADIAIGTTDGSGLGGGGDSVVIWLGDPSTSIPLITGTYPDTETNDGQSYDLELNEFSVIGNANEAVQTYTLGGSSENVPNIGSPGNGIPFETLEVQFETSFISIAEDGTSVTARVSISSAPIYDVLVDVILVQGGTAIEGVDFTFPTSQTILFSENSGITQEITFDILNNMNDNSDVFFVVELQNIRNSFLGDNELFSVYILDDDTVVPEADLSVLGLEYNTSYTVTDDGTAEIVTYDATSQRLFVSNATKIEIIDFSDPTALASFENIDITSIGAEVQSVAAKNGILAAAISANEKTDNGFVLLTDINGNNPVVLEVGALPDMLTFTPDGTSIVVANEGEPNDDYSIDPEGSVSIIDIRGGLEGTTQADVRHVNFTEFNGQEVMLNANGIRIYGPNALASQDFEPEYIAVSSDSQTAYVTLQENNAYAIIDIPTAAIVEVFSFGLKDHSLPENSLDLSDETDFIFNAAWPVKGMYMPDAISFYGVGGIDYIVTANEGDSREYNTFEEEQKIDDSDYVLDSSVFGATEILELETNLAEINVTNASGDIDGDGDFDEIHIFGGRSFSIFEAATGVLVYDSANDFEVIIAADPVYGAIFNASNSNNNLKNRSDNKGPEPEGVLVQEINGSFYAFILLERIGGVMVYDITDPNAPVFLAYVNNREVTPGGDEMGDLGPEGLVYISEEESTNGIAYLLVANEVSATLSVIALENIVLRTQDINTIETSFKMYPNPASNLVFFSIPDTYSVYDVLGNLLTQVNDAASINVKALPIGIYFVTNSNKNTKKLLIK
jgi:hypothetical protein